jgi:hypothetical protein
VEKTHVTGRIATDSHGCFPLASTTAPTVPTDPGTRSLFPYSGAPCSPVEMPVAVPVPGCHCRESVNPLLPFPVSFSLLSSPKSSPRDPHRGPAPISHPFLLFSFLTFFPSSTASRSFLFFYHRLRGECAIFRLPAAPLHIALPILEPRSSNSKTCISRFTRSQPTSLVVRGGLTCEKAVLWLI